MQSQEEFMVEVKENTASVLSIERKFCFGVASVVMVALFLAERLFL